MKFSIIVPIYNVENYLPKCINSLVEQTYNGKYEIILINDGSTDNSLEIAKKYEKEYPNIKLFSKKNGGLSSARNYGISKSEGEYLLFVDSDDYIDLKSLEKLDKKLEEDNYDIIVFNFFTDTDDILESVNTYNSDITDPIKRYLVSLPSACNKLVSRKILNKSRIKFLENVYYEDLATMPKFSLYTNKIGFLADELYYYVKRSGSIMNQVKYNQKMDSIFEIFEGLREYFKNEYSSEIEYLHIYHLLRAASIRYLDCDNCNKQLNKIIDIIKINYPKWNHNVYYKKLDIKKRIICNLIYHKKYKLISYLRQI